MNDKKINALIPYIGIPILCAGFFLKCISWMPPIEILNYVLLIAFGYIVALIDFRTKTIPNYLLLLMLAVWTVIQIPVFVNDFAQGFGYMVSAAMGGIIGGGLFLVVYILSNKGLGAGDVKLMAVAGLYLGFNAVLPSMLIGSILSAVTAVGLMAMKKIDKNGTLPLAPFLYVGMLITLFLL